MTDVYCIAKLRGALENQKGFNFGQRLQGQWTSHSLLTTLLKKTIRLFIAVRKDMKPCLCCINLQQYLSPHVKVLKEGVGYLQKENSLPRIFISSKLK